MGTFKEGSSTFQDMIKECKDIEIFYKTVLRNITVIIGIKYEDLEPESEEVVNELVMQGIMSLDDEERELLFLRYGLMMEANMIAQIMGISGEEVHVQSSVVREKFERMLKGE